MSISKKLLAFPVLAFAAWLAAAAAPNLAVRVTPPNPVAGQRVLLTAVTPQEDSGWLWDFGDGRTAQCPAAEHAWEEPGTYRVHVQTQGASADISVVVSPSDTLRLHAGHPFEATIRAVDPQTGTESAGQAFGQDDGYGYFRFPEIAGEAEGPAVTLRILDPEASVRDARPDAGNRGDRYRVSWGSLTDLDYTLTVRDVGTGQVEIYRGAGAFAGGVDAGSFPRQRPDLPDMTRPDPYGGVPGRGLALSPTPGAVATATRTPLTPGPSTTPAQTGTPGATHTPSSTPTPTGTPTSTPTPTVTPTPTASGPIFIGLRAIQWQWDFFSTALGVNGGSSITLQVGQTYQIRVCNEDLADVTDVHQFGGISGLGLDGGALPNGTCLAVQTFTPSGPGDYPFSCTNYCGVGHDGMVGAFHVAP